MIEPAPLHQVIAGLESQRAVLGDAAVDAAIAALRQHAPAASVGEPAPPPPPVMPPQPQQQRLRQVSILFADIAGSTSLLGRLGAEDAAALVGRVLEGFAVAVQAEGGEVLRFTGDGIKAAFGTRGLREDDAERAVHAGLRILRQAQADAAQAAREHGVAGFGVRVGIHTGPVLLGGGVEVERGAVGHAVHLAARMEQSAPVGRLRISDATWALVRGLFRAERQPPLHVKGHDEALQTWLVEAPEQQPEPRVQRGLDGVHVPLLGRQDELAQLRAMHTRAAAQGRLQATWVLGEAGVGKTRLRMELLAALGRQEGHPGLLQARAHPSTPLQPYGLLRQLVARWVGLRDDVPAAQARECLLQGLTPWLGPEAAQDAPRVGALIGLDFADEPAVRTLSPAALQARAFAALQGALLARARQAAAQGHGALWLVLDDLHWADEASLAFVRQLLAPAEAPLALLLLARPELREGAMPSPAAGLEPGLIELTALSPPAARELLETLLRALPGRPARLDALLLERAQGNPFYLEALVRMLVDDGAIDTTGRPWVLHAGRLDTLRVPPTLVGVLQARLDALPAHEQRALQQASIVGPVFWTEALHELDAAAPTALPGLRQRALVARRDGSVFSQTEEHAFAHQLLHDTTYATVLKPARRAGHARAAAWLARRLGDRAGEFLAVTAEHYERAGDSAQALEYWDRAQTDAFRRFANHEALRFNERALAQPALTDPSWRHHLLSNRCTLFDRVGDTAAAAEARATLAAWAETCDDDALRAERLSHDMLRADHEGRPDEARELAHRIIELAARAPHRFAWSAAALARGELAWLAMLRRDHAEVMRQVALGLEPARLAAQQPRRHGGYGGYELQLRQIAISALIEQERHVEALREIRSVKALLQAGGVGYDHFSVQHRECQALRRLGRLEEAEATARALLALAHRLGVARLVPAAFDTLATILHWQQAWERLADTLEDLQAVAAGNDQGVWLPVLADHRAGLARGRGDADAARLHWAEAVQGLQAQGQAPRTWPMRAEIAQLDLEQGRPDEARAGIDGLLLEAGAELAADAEGSDGKLQPEALWRCWCVLDGLADARAPALARWVRHRLQEQLAALDEPAARRWLLTGVPHWREAARRLGIGLADPGLVEPAA